jgi:two-component system, chemotaxis family, response regulator Rcp1
MKTPPEVLLVDDNPADTDLISEALGRTERHYRVSAVHDGVQAVAFLRREGKYAEAPRPDLIVLDLNLPRKDGREVLSEVKSDPRLAITPIVVFTTSQADPDVQRSYELGANCYLRKPGSLADFRAAIQSMADFWLNFATLPPPKEKQ